MKKFLCVMVLISSLFFSAPAYCEGITGFLWDLAVDAAIGYAKDLAIDYAKEVVTDYLNGDTSQNSASGTYDSYWDRRVVAEKLSLREQPDKKSTLTTQINFDTVIHVHQTSGENSLWSYVETKDGLKGWASSDYIAPLKGYGIKGTATGNLNVRMTPEANSPWNMIGIIKKDSEILILRRWTVKNRIWYYAQTSVGNGWVSSKYIKN